MPRLPSGEPGGHSLRIRQPWRSHKGSGVVHQRASRGAPNRSLVWNSDRRCRVARWGPRLTSLTCRSRDPTISLMKFVTALRWLLAALIAFGLVTGTTASATPSGMAQQAVMAMTVDIPCAAMASMQSDEVHASPVSVPCTSMTADCVKQITCVQIVGLPNPTLVSYVPIVNGLVRYARRPDAATGITRQPNLFPPIAD